MSSVNIAEISLFLSLSGLAMGPFVSPSVSREGNYHIVCKHSRTEYAKNTRCFTFSDCLLSRNLPESSWNPKKTTKMNLKMRESMVKSSQKEDASGAPATGHSSRILFLTAFTSDFLRFEFHFSCSVWVLTRDGISERVLYGLRTNLPFINY